MDGTGLLVILFGLVLGSFLNACIYRIPRGESVLWPGSRCPHCRQRIRPRDNIPVLSFLFLRGRCRHCRRPIGWIYPAVELLTAGCYYLLYLKYGLSFPFFIGLVFSSLLLVLAFIDLHERILPNAITYPGIILGVLVSPFQSVEFFEGDVFLGTPAGAGEHPIHALLGVLLGGGLLWLVAVLYEKLRKVEGMGFGDVKMMAMVGAFLGWRYAWLTIFLGSLAGALVGSLYLVASGKGRRYELPFGTFLALGALVVTLWGRALLGWYSGLLGP